MRAVGFDSKVVKRDKRNFKALLGVSVLVNNYETFSQKYHETIDNALVSVALPRGKRVYKSSDLTEITFRAGVDMVSLVAKELLKHIDFLDVYYTYFEPEYQSNIIDKSKIREVKEIGCYFAQEIERISPIKFIDLISSYYPLLCCHAYLKYKQVSLDERCYLDHCSSITPSLAVRSVLSSPNVKFVIKGDQINPVIASADIICRYVDEMCLNNGFALNKHLQRNLNFDVNRFQTTFIGPSWLYDIKPSHREILNISHKCLHPIFYFITAPNTESVFGKKARDTLEKSKIFSAALEVASQLNGSVKLFESNDQLYMNKEDFVVIHDDYSEKVVKDLIRLGCQAKVITHTYFEK